MFDATDILEGGESGVVSGVAEGCDGVHISSGHSLSHKHTLVQWELPETALAGGKQRLVGCGLLEQTSGDGGKDVS